jgi:hypothetical protein
MMREIRNNVESINSSIANRLDEVAQILEEQGANEEVSLIEEARSWLAAALTRVSF